MNITDKVKFPTQGISGKLYVVIQAVILAGIFSLGLFLFAPNPGAIWATLGKIGGFMREFGIKLFIAVVATFIQAAILFHFVLDTKLSHLRLKLNKQGNNSHIILLTGLFLTIVITLAFAKGLTFRDYAFLLSTKGVLGYATAFVLTIATSRLFGVRSMDEFRDWIELEQEDSHAILVASMMVGVMLLAMSV